MSIDFSKLLQSIGSVKTAIVIEQAVAAVNEFKKSGLVEAAKSNNELPQYPQGSLESDIIGLETQVRNLTTELYEVATLLYAFQQAADKQLQEVLRAIENSISDVVSASNSTTLYNREWFANLLMSEDAKVTIANKLLERCTVFTKSNLNTFKLIAERDPEMLEAIRLPIDMQNLEGF